MKSAQKELALHDVKARDREGALRELAGVLARQEGLGPEEERRVLDAILERERAHSTALGSGVAIPHTRSDKVREVKVVLGRSREGLDFKAPDGQPVHLVFLFISPKIGIQIHTEALARVAKLALEGRFDSVKVASMRENELWELMEEVEGGSPKRK